MSNAQHMLVRIIAVAVLVALHWFPHTHAAPVVASAGASNASSGESAVSVHGETSDGPAAEHATGSEAVGVATIP